MVWDKWSPAAVGSSRGSRVAGAAGGGVQRAPLHRTLLVLLEGRQGGDCPEGRGAGGQGAKSRAQRGSSGSASGGINLIGFNPCKNTPSNTLLLSESRPTALSFPIPDCSRLWHPPPHPRPLTCALLPPLDEGS